MIERMDIPATRAEFERRLFLLREQLECGKLLFPHGMNMSVMGFHRVRLLPNGRIDLRSVSEFVRLHANMIAQMPRWRDIVSEDATSEMDDEDEEKASESNTPQSTKGSSRSKGTTKTASHGKASKVAGSGKKSSAVEDGGTTKKQVLKKAPVKKAPVKKAPAKRKRPQSRE